VRAEVATLAQQVEVFSGVKGERGYLYMDEMLTRQLLRLDDVETGGDDEVRTRRKEAIRGIQESLARLEERCSPRAGAAAGSGQEGAEAEVGPAGAGGAAEVAAVAGDAQNGATEAAPGEPQGKLQQETAPTRTEPATPSEPAAAGVGDPAVDAAAASASGAAPPEAPADAEASVAATETMDQS